MGKVLQEEIVKYYCHLTPQNSFYLPLTPLYTKLLSVLLHSCTPELLKKHLLKSPRVYPVSRRGPHGVARRAVLQCETARING